MVQKNGCSLKSIKVNRTHPGVEGLGDVTLERSYQRGPWKRLLAGLVVQPGVPLNQSEQVSRRWQERVLPSIKVNARQTDPFVQLACFGAKVFYCRAVAFSF